MKTETTPQHLSPEFWAKCLEVRQFLLNALDGLILGVGLLEPDSDNATSLQFHIAPNEAIGGAITYDLYLETFTVSDRLYVNLSDFSATVHTLGRPAAQVTALLRKAVELLDNVE
jgi:hypothetical protein